MKGHHQWNVNLKRYIIHAPHSNRTDFKDHKKLQSICVPLRHGLKSTYLGVVCTNRPRTPERAVWVTLLRIWIAVVSHLIIPGLDMVGGGTVPKVIENKFYFLPELFHIKSSLSEFNLCIGFEVMNLSSTSLHIHTCPSVLQGFGLFVSTYGWDHVPNGRYEPSALHSSLTHSPTPGG